MALVLKPQEEVKMIMPTIGRVVLYRKSTGSGTQPNAAIITFVHSDRMVNLVVFNENGVAHGETSVTLMQTEEEASNPSFVGPFCEWMPYQKGQAAKTEALEQKMAAVKE